MHWALLGIPGYDGRIQKSVAQLIAYSARWDPGEGEFNAILWNWTDPGSYEMEQNSNAGSRSSIYIMKCPSGRHIL